MKIGYDLSERSVEGWGDSHALRRVLAALGDSGEVDGVWLFAPFGMKAEVAADAAARSAGDGAGRAVSWRHVAVHPVLARLPRVWRNLRMPLHLKRSGVDVYHAMTGEIPWRMALSRQRMVVSVDDVSFLASPMAFGMWDRLVMRCRCYFSCRVAHRVIAPDESVRSVLAAFGVERGKIVVMAPFAYGRRAVPPSAGECGRVRRLYGLPERYFFMSGGIVASESYGEAVEALAKVAAGRNDDPGLVVCGRRTHYSDCLLEYAARAGVWHKVNIIYECGRRDAEVIRSMALGQLILPQADRSAQQVTDAVASGVPVVASDCGRMRAAGGDAVLYADPRSPDAIAGAMRALLDGDVAESLRAAMRERAADLSPERAARRLIEIYGAL